MKPTNFNPTPTTAMYDTLPVILTDSVKLALKRIEHTVLSRSVTIIQGAHGTGKTHLARLAESRWTRQEHPDWTLKRFACLREINVTMFARVFTAGLTGRTPLSYTFPSPWECAAQVSEFLADTPGTLIYMDGAHLLGDRCVDWLLQVHGRIRDEGCSVGIAFAAVPPAPSLHSVSLAASRLAPTRLRALDLDDIAFVLGKWSPLQFEDVRKDYLKNKPAARKLFKLVHDETGGIFQRLEALYRAMVITSTDGILSEQTVREAAALLNGGDQPEPDQLRLAA